MSAFAGWVHAAGAGAAPERATLERMLGAVRRRGARLALGLRGPLALGATGEEAGSFAAADPVWAAVCGRFSGSPRRGPEGRTAADGSTRPGPSARLRAAHAAWGPDLLGHLSGGFALALWDGNAGRLLLARDHAGVRPLYYFRDGELLAFASEIGALLPHPRAPREVNREVVPEYLAYRYASGAATLFRGIRELEPGWRLAWEDGVVRLEPYWDLPYEADRADSLGAGEYVRRIDSVLGEVIRDRFGDDGRLGVLLSGGLDSSLLTALARPAAPRPLRSWSVGVDDPRLDETPRAETVARLLGTTHSSRRVGAREYAAALPAAIAANEQPLHHPNSVALYLVAREAAREVDGLAMGEGADSSFGNRAAQKLRLAGSLERCLPLPALLLGCSALAAVGLGRFRQLHELLGADPEEFALTSNFFCPSPVVRELLGLADDAPILAPRRRFFEGRSAWPPLGRLLYYYQKTEMVASFNVFGKMLSAAGIEPCMPFADRAVQELSCRIPLSLKASLRRAKPLLVRVARRHLPREVVDWPKLSFGFPIGAWFRRADVLRPYADLLAEPRTLDRGLLRPDAVRRVLAEHHRADADHGEGALWTAVNLELWARIHLDAIPAEAILAAVGGAPPAG